MNIVVTVGKFSPPHTGHLALIEFLSEQANKLNAKAYVAPTESNNKEENPLTFKQKVKYMTEMLKPFSNVELWPAMTKSPYELIRDLCFECEKSGGGTVTMFVGSDRVEGFTKMANSTLKRYQDRNECMNVNVEVKEAMDRENDPRAYSATKMRQHVLDNNVEEFIKHVPFDNRELALEMFNDVKEGMQSSGFVQTVHSDMTPDEIRAITVEMAKKINSHINIVTNQPDVLYYVGGCVRDEMMGKKPNDFDLVTTMYYQDFSQMFDTEDIRFRGKRVIVVPVIQGEPFETACLGRGETLETRQIQSDLTINSMAINILTNELIDPLHGNEDIKNQIIRSSDWAKEGFRRGGLHTTLLRIFRFLSQLDWEIEYDTLDAVQEFSKVTGGKIKATEAQFEKDWNKLLKGKARDKALRLLKDFGFHDYLLKTQPLYRDYYEAK